jgi:hypothetical protein
MLVKSHMHSAPELAAGVASLPGVSSAFAATQGAWRFLNNDRVELSALAAPLREIGRSRTAGSQACFALLVHDWCKLSYSSGSKQDLVQLTHETDVGYELTNALLVSADDGSPLAPMEMHVRTAHGVLSTRDPAPRVRPHLEQVLPTMEASRTWDLSKLLVHVIDREADSVDHYRRWDAKGHKFLIRADDRRVKWNGQSILLSEIRSQLKRRQEFRHVGAAAYHGRPAELWVVETDVVLYRPAKKNVRGKKYARPGPPLALRHRRATPRRTGKSVGRVDAAQQRAAWLGDDRASGSLLLLALEDREFFQAAQKPRPATGALATGDRPGHCTSPVDRCHGLRHRLATAGRRFARSQRVQKRARAIERTADEARTTAHRASAAGRLVDPAVHVRVVATVRPPLYQAPRCPNAFSRHGINVV